MIKRSLYENPTEKFSVWKRFLIFLIDGITTVGVTLALFLTVCNYSISALAKTQINNINVIMQEVCTEKSVPYKEGRYGLYRVDTDKYIQLLEESGMAGDKAVEEGYNMVEKIDDLVVANKNYKDNYHKFRQIYLVNFIACLSISTIVFQLVIPLTNKNRRTLGMMTCRASLVDAENIIVDNKMAFFRFGVILLLELVAVYLIIGWLGIIFEALISIFIISITNRRLTIHDALLRTKIIDSSKAFTE